MLKTSQEFQLDFVTSADGTSIGYRFIGSGPNLILLHGGLQSSLNFTSLARALSADFKVYIPDRRGRGLSGAYQEQDDLITETEDLLTLIRSIKAELVFALSSGAIITLAAASSEPHLQKIALYEPPIPVDPTMLQNTRIDYHAAMDQGNLGKAFLAIVKGTGDPGERSFFNVLPAFIAAPLINRLIRLEKKRSDPTRLPLAQLIPTFKYDGRIVGAALPLIDHAKTIRAAVLLLGGSKSQPYLSKALDALEKALPSVSRVTYKQLGHLAADNSERPAVIAETLKQFFLNEK